MSVGFISDERDNDTFMDIVIKSLNDKPYYVKLIQYLKNEEFDTDAIKLDVSDITGNIKLLINKQEVVDIINEMIQSQSSMYTSIHRSSSDLSVVLSTHSQINIIFYWLYFLLLGPL